MMMKEEIRPILPYTTLYQTRILRIAHRGICEKKQDFKSPRSTEDAKENRKIGRSRVIHVERDSRGDLVIITNRKPLNHKGQNLLNRRGHNAAEPQPEPTTEA